MWQYHAFIQAMWNNRYLFEIFSLTMPAAVTRLKTLKLGMKRQVFYHIAKKIKTCLKTFWIKFCFWHQSLMSQYHVFIQLMLNTRYLFEIFSLAMPAAVTRLKTLKLGIKRQVFYHCAKEIKTCLNAFWILFLFKGTPITNVAISFFIQAMWNTKCFLKFSRFRCQKWLLDPNPQAWNDEASVPPLC